MRDPSTRPLPKPINSVGMTEAARDGRNFQVSRDYLNTLILPSFMRKEFFLYLVYGLLVFTLIIAFENIFITETYTILFFPIELSSTFLIFFSTGLGIMIGFFFMMYSFEIRREKELAEHEDAIAEGPGATVNQPVEKAPEAPKVETTVDAKTVTPDDEDDEVLG
jgi:hypothetical protein